jgi:cobalt-zinc-cadmium efflux system outer membrane protein
MFSRAFCCCLFGAVCLLPTWAQPSPPMEEEIRQHFSHELEPQPLKEWPKPDRLLKLSLEEAIRLGLERNPDHLAAQSRSRQSYWRYQTTTALPHASLVMGTQSGYGIGYINGTFSGQGGFDNYLQVFQPIGILGARATDRKIAVADVSRSLQDQEQTRVDTIHQVKDNYYQLVAAQKQVRVTQQNAALAQQILDVAQRRAKVGAGPEVDVINADIQLKRALQDLRSAEANELVQDGQLKPWLNLENTAKIDCQDDFQTLPPPPTLAQALELAKQNPRMLSAQLQADKSRLQAVRADQDNNPFFNTIGFYSLVNHSWGMNFQMAIPMDWGDLRNTSRAAHEQVNEQALAAQKTLLNLQTEIQGNLDSYRAIASNAQEFADKILQPAERTLKIYQSGYAVGVVPYIQVLTVQQQVVSARLDLVNRQLLAQEALDALEASLAQPLLIKR